MKPFNDEERRRIEIYGHELELKRYGFSLEDVEKYKGLDHNSFYKLVFKYREKEEQELRIRQSLEVKAFLAKEKADKKKETLNFHIKEHLKELKRKEQHSKEVSQIAKKKYKNEKCASLQVFINKDVVNQFKWLVKIHGDSQASVIKDLLQHYIDSNSVIKPDGTKARWDDKL